MKEKAVITAAGLGTRLLSVTKAQPKEMLPVFARCRDGGLCMKPIVQLVFEDLYLLGFREFCFVVGRGKRTIREHFEPDVSFLSLLDKKGKNGLAKEMEAFYEMVDRSSIVWVTQPEPRGFGDAVMMTEKFVNGDRFVLHAGDNFFISKDLDHLKHLLVTADSMGTHATFLVQEVRDPRNFGVVEAEAKSGDIINVKHVEEKPELPASHLAIMPVYLFKPTIFEALNKTKLGHGGELQLTDAIERLIARGLGVSGIDVGSGVIRLDVGSPDSYLEAQLVSYRWSVGERQTEELEPSLIAGIRDTD